MTHWEHQEYPISSLRPRHPIVCLIDLVSVVIVIGMVQYHGVRNIAVALYATSLICMYLASIAHHWFEHGEARHRADHSMIFVVIAMTAAPYWGSLFFWWPGIVMIGLTIFFGTLIRLNSNPPRLVSASLYSAASLPMFCNWQQFWDGIPEPWNVVFMFGVALYGLQLLIYTHEWCDWFPQLFGFREVQHIVLLAAVLCHLTTAFIVVG